tara:strand:- start:60 stop:338 length:279 start_codon:yes stop_codon:yes gene_type:complete
MNKHIELVKKWLADNDSVSNEELTKNSVDAMDAWVYAEGYADAGGSARVAADAADLASLASFAAIPSEAAADADDDADAAAYWVKRYEELTK